MFERKLSDYKYQPINDKAMKKHLILLFSVLMAFGFPSCSDDEQEPPVVEPEVVTLSVGTENGYGEELPVTWNEGDQLGVFAAETLNGTFLLSGGGRKSYK